MSSIIRFLVKDRLLICVNRPALYSGGQNYDKAVFVFDDTWAGFVKTASFSRGTEVYHMLLDEDDACNLPNEIVADRGSFCVGVFGVSGDVVKTTQTFCFDVWDGAITAYTTIPDPTPDIYAQILASIQSTQRPFPIYVAVSNGTATINAKYSNTQNISYRFGKCTANNLPDFSSFAFIDNTASSVSDAVNTPAHYINTSDCFAPYDVAALNLADGEVGDVEASHSSNSLCGGNHVYTAADGMPILTAKNNYLRFYADGMPLTSGGRYCSSVRIEWENDIMAWNTVKTDGTGIYVLTEAITMNFDGKEWKIEKIITSKRDSVLIKSHHGLQFLLRYCDRYNGYLRFLGSEACRESVPTDRRNYSSYHLTGDVVYCDDKLCDTILISDDTNAVQMGLEPYDLGRYNYCKFDRAVTMPDGQKVQTISSAYSSTSKAYFNPILWGRGYYDESNTIPLGLELGKGESVYMRGFYRFYPADATAANVLYPITVVLGHASQQTGDQTHVSKRSEAYLHFTADSGYLLPETVTVTGATSSWARSEDGKTASLLLIKPTGDITVSVTAAAEEDGETWVINETPTPTAGTTTKMTVDYVSNNTTFDYFWTSTTAANRTTIKFRANGVDTTVYTTVDGWTDAAYRTIKLDEATGDLLTWLTANATKL